MVGVLIKGGNLDTVTHTGRMPCEEEGRDGGDASTSQKIIKDALQPPAAKGVVWNKFSFMALGRNIPYQHLHLTILGSTAVRK